jgi:hypothetical protein
MVVWRGAEEDVIIHLIFGADNCVVWGGATTGDWAGQPIPLETGGGLLDRLFGAQASDRPRQVGNSRKHAFRMENKRWPDVFAWLAEETGLPVCQSGVGGSFTFIGPKRAKYTIPEIVNIMNCTLVPQGWLMIQGQQSFEVVFIEDELAKFLGPQVD